MTDDIDPTGGTVRDAVQQKGYGHEVELSDDDSVGKSTINWYCDVCGATGAPRQGGQRTWDTMHNEAFRHVKGTHPASPPDSFHVTS